jgi:dihydrofolate synthase / folylpolyglutamate synthase
MDELEGLAYLREFPDFEQGTVSAAQTFGLDRVLALLHEVGSPHLRLPVIHIAGTKGKGSTAVSIAGILRAAGYTTGLFTQPHLISLYERFQIDGSEIADVTLSEIMVERIRPAMKRLAVRGIVGVQQFEAQVAVAMLWFETRNVDVVVLEVGLGGRLDATNVVPAPIVTALTPIGFDHTAILGNTLSLIAAEKAAIIKPGSIAISSPQSADAATVIAAAADELDVPLFLGGRDWLISNVLVAEAGTNFDFVLTAQMRNNFDERLQGTARAIIESADALSSLFTPLRGAHQAVNAGCAVAVAIAAAPRLPRINVETIRRGLSMVQWPGRLQIIGRSPTTIVDGAHTPESAGVLVAAIRDLFPGRRVILVCGIPSDKDIARIIGVFRAFAEHVVATRAAHPRAAPAADIAAAFLAAGHNSVEVRDGAFEALTRARQLAGPHDVILVTGSLYLVGDVLKNLRAQSGNTERDA